MEVRILGRVEVIRGGDTTAIEGSKERSILSALALEPGHVVTSGRLTQVLWGAEPPDTAMKTLQWHVSRLRRSVGGDEVETDPNGYRLRASPQDIDASRFEGLLRDARASLLADDPGAAVAHLDEALALWKGPLLADGADCDYCTGQQRRFDELHTLARERRCEAELALGHHASMIPELHALVAEHPYRDRPRELLMLALYRSGRHADALRAYAAYRALLIDELGIDPSDTIRELEERILRHDPQLDHRPPLPPTNLPYDTDAIVGRDDAIEAVMDAVSTSRLVTLVGAGGMGKSRLARAAAERVRPEFRDGTWWIDLAALRPDGHLIEHVGAVLGVAPAPTETAEGALADHLARRHTLIVLDNCEHLVSEAASVAEELITAGPGVRVLTTSRAAIGLPAEHRMMVFPLDTQASSGSMPLDRPRSDATELFLRRASERRTIAVDEVEGDDVAELCRMLGGIPLAIEIAAARSDVLTAREMIDEIESTGLLPSSPDPAPDARHESVEHVLDWSYALLDMDERDAFDRLAVFRGDFDLDAAAAVIGVSRAEATRLLGRFLAASMLTPLESEFDRRRFRLLEPLRLYARSHLDDAQHDDARRAHAAHYRSLCSATPCSLKPDVTLGRARILRDDANITAAIEFSLDSNHTEDALAFADNIGDAWYRSGQYRRCHRVLTTMLDGADEAPPGLRAAARNNLVWSALLSGAADEAFAHVTVAIEEATEAEDAFELAFARWSLAHMLVLGVGDFAAAFPLYDAAIEAAGSDAEHFGTLVGLGVTARAQARALADIHVPEDDTALGRAAQVLEDINDISGLAHVWMARSLRSIQEGRIDRIERDACRTIEYARLANEPVYEHIGLFCRGVGELLAGDLTSSLDTTYASVRICEATHNELQLGVSLQGLGMVAIEADMPAEGALLYGAGTSLAAPWPMFERLFAPYLATCSDALGDAYDETLERGAELTAAESSVLASSVRLPD